MRSEPTPINVVWRRRPRPSVSRLGQAVAIVVATLMSISSVAGLPKVAELPVVELKINGHAIRAEVAATEGSRTTGLMHRFSLRPDSGMLFVFGTPQPLAFWMKNTYVPLSIAFIASDGRILNIEDMAPQTENSHWSRGMALYALEMKKGWFAAHEIRPGDRVEGVDSAPRSAD